MQLSLDDYVDAANVATELVNTAPGVWSGVDKLSDVPALERFLSTRVTPIWGREPEDPSLTEEDVAEVRRLRDRLRELIDSPDPDLLVRRATDLTRAVGGLTLAVGETDRTHWQATSRAGASHADRLALVSAVGVLGVLHALGADRFRPCASGTCSGVFIDSSRNGRRRYCMPERCGNRVNVANHRARQKAG